MIARRFSRLLLTLLLATGVAACASGGIPQGYVKPASGTVPSASGATGRVVSITEATVQGVQSPKSGGGGNGALVGGAIGAAGGSVIGSSIGNGGLVGAVLGAVGGAIAGVIVERQSGSGRGVEVVVEKDDGQKVTIAQADDTDIQLGDRVKIVEDANGVAKAVRDTAPRT